MASESEALRHRVFALKRRSQGVTLMVNTDGYVLGHSDVELKRLATQARLIDPITRRFLVSAGIREGMRVLDVGSGAGDVAVLLAGLVGPSGEVEPGKRSVAVISRNRKMG
jgi:tRNA A58 N-methylase Trm61